MKWNKEARLEADRFRRRERFVERGRAVGVEIILHKDDGIAPASLGSMGIGQKQDARVALAVRPGLALAQDGFELLAFFGTEADVMLFLWLRIHLYSDKNSTRLFFGVAQEILIWIFQRERDECSLGAWRGSWSNSGSCDGAGPDNDAAARSNSRW